MINNSTGILIVEDSPTQAEQLRYILEEYGYHVLVAYNGNQALALANHHQPTIIISDIVMPEMDGYQLCCHIKKDEHLKDIPVILLTALSDPMDIVRGLDCGADNFIIKPYDEKYLLSRIQYILANRELRKGEKVQMGVEILFAGQRHFITSERQQILDILLSTYEAAVQKNLELISARDELKELNEHLERKVKERTAALMAEIAERRRAEEALEVALRSWQNTFEVISDGIWILDLEGHVLQSNGGLERLLGIKTENVPDRHCYQVLHQTHDFIERCPFKRMKQTNTRESVELEDKKREIWFQVITEPIRDKFGAIKNVVHIVRDITELKRAEEEIRLLQTITLAISESENLDTALLVVLQTLCHATGWAYGEAWISHPNGTLLERSPAWYSRVGGLEKFSTLSEGLTFPPGKGLPGRVWASKQPVWMQDVRVEPDFLRASIAREVGLKAGVAIPVLTDNEVVAVLTFFMFEAREEDERSIRLVSSVAAQLGSVIQRKQAEEALRQQLTRINLLNQIAHAVAQRQDLGSIFRVALGQLEEYLPIDFGGVLLFDPHADTLTVVARGPKSQLLAAGLGIAEGTVIPTRHAASGACLKKGAVVYLPDLTQMDRPTPQKLAQAGIRSMMMTPLVVEGKTIGVLTVARREVDGFRSSESEFLQMLGEHVALAAHQAQLYQDLQKAYEELRQTQRVVMQQERLRALGQMASGISHDINNTLSPVVGFADLLLMNEPNLSERGKRYLKNIQTAGMDISHIVGRMREFYRQREEEEEPLLPIDLNSLVRQVLDLTRPRWKDIPQASGIVVAMRTELDPELPLVPGIESEIREALTNLAFNAVDALPQGGTITIRTYMDAWASGIGEEGTPTYVVLEVADTGIGMGEETRQRCLEPFFSTKGERGTGLGLAMVYGVMQRHEGEIDIESAPGQGTTMRLIFPAHIPAESNGFARPEATEPLRPLYILCIDDEPLLREVVREMLENDGHRVEVADGGQAGLDLFRAAKERGDPFEVVITDLGMPYVDGREVVRTVKQESPATPVILLTGWSKRMKMEVSLPTPVDYVLSKPPRMRRLREALARATQTLRQTP